jgi:Transglycosylase SLT domain
MLLMPRQLAGKSRPRKTRNKKRASRRWRIAALWPGVRLRRRALSTFRRAPRFLQVLLGLSAAAILWFALNGIYQVVRKPSELFFPVSGTLNKTPSEIWRQYGPLFQQYSTNEITPELLAALAQIEASGNPVARTYWRWSWKPGPFDVYRPASSAVGMYQITNGTFAEARRYCIRRHAVVEDGPWKDWNSCWFNSLYTRVVPSHAVELTAAYLDRSVASALDRHPSVFATLERKQELAALIHLCGAGAGDAYVRRGMRFTVGQRCGDHDARDYVARVNMARRVFEAFRAAGT